jgi:hypothetical protein
MLGHPAVLFVAPLLGLLPADPAASTQPVLFEMQGLT